MSETPPRYRIDDLARLAGTTVRNVRAYQDRGLLPPPEKVGRVGWYSEAHLAGLRLITEMLDRGYSLANIAELIDGWIRGQDLGDVLGLEAALIAPWGERRATVYSREELRELFAPLGPDYLDAAVSTGLVTVDGDRYQVADPRLIDGALVLVEAGVPMEAVLALGAEIAAATDHIAAMYVGTVVEHVVGERPVDDMAPAEMRHLSEVVMRLRPLAMEMVAGTLAAALERRIGAEVGERRSPVSTVVASAGAPTDAPGAGLMASDAVTGWG